MKRIYIQAIDAIHKTYEQASLLVEKQALEKACLHLNIDSTTIEWSKTMSIDNPLPNTPNHVMMCGWVKGTSKLVTYIEVEE